MDRSSSERRWVIPELPDHEVTDIMAHGFGVLHRMVISAHAACNMNYGGTIFDASGRPACMIAMEGTRLAYYNFSKKETFNINIVDSKFPFVDKNKVIERYGEENISLIASGEKDIYGLAESFMEMGKVILKKR